MAKGDKWEWEETGGRGRGEIGRGRSTGGARRKGVKRDSQGEGNREKYKTFNRNSTKRLEPLLNGLNGK